MRTKHFVTGAAVGVLMLSAALAQQSPGTPTSSAPTAATSGTTEVVTLQKPDQWLASKFKGTEVLGADGKKIGAIADILFDKGGKIEAYVVSTGGFLGVGAKEVALPPSAFEIVQGQNGGADKLKIAMGQNELKQAENFKRYAPPSATTTGAGTGNTRPPANTAPNR